MIHPPAVVFQEWLGARPEAARVALALDPDRLLCDSGLLGWSTVADAAGREWHVVPYRGDELAFRLRFRKTADSPRRVLIITRGEGSNSPVDVSTLADVLGCNEGGPALDLSLPAYLRRLIPKINFPPQELRRHKAALLAQVNAVPGAAAKIIQRWNRPDDWGRGQVAALVFLARHPEQHLSDLWPEETQPIPFLCHALRALLCWGESEADSELLLEIIHHAAAPQVRGTLFWFAVPTEELAGLLVLRRFTRDAALQNPATQLTGLGIFGADTPLDRLEPSALAVADALQQDSQAWSAVEARAEEFLTARRLQKVMSLVSPTTTDLHTLAAAASQPGVASAILMHFLRELLLAFCKQAGVGAAVILPTLEHHPYLAQSSEPASAMRQACRAALLFLVTAGRVEQRLATLPPPFSHAEALLDWYVQSGHHKLELETAQTTHWLEACGEDAVLQEGHHYLFGTGDDVSPSPAALKGRVRQRLHELDCRLATIPFDECLSHSHLIL